MSWSRRKAAVVTTSRAEYGLLYWLCRRLQEDPSFQLQLVVGGAHLKREFGRTVEQIRADGFRVAAEVDMLEPGDTDETVAKSIGKGVIGFTEAFARLRPDVVVMLGDRFELLAAASAAAALRVPIAHLHGGEATEGVLDDRIRHAVTKLSHLHFVAAEPYRRRVIQMGEDPRRVFLVGAPGLESIERLEPLGRGLLEAQLGFDLSRPLAVMTYHPTTGSNGAAAREAAEALAALEASGARGVLTFAGADAGGRSVNEALLSFQRRHPGRFLAAASLGQRTYLSLLRNADVVFGNSSSGILEAPSLRVPTVNVGDRQQGRLRAPSVLDCEPTRPAMLRALRRALSSSFRRSHCRGQSPYLGGRVSERILRALKAAELGPALLKKPFYELPWRRGS